MNGRVSFLHAGADKNPSYRRFCRSLSDLGIDLSGDSFRNRNHATVFDGRQSISDRWNNHVCDRVVARDHQIQLGKLAYFFDYWRLFDTLRKRRGNSLRKVHRFGAGGADCGDSSDLHRSAGVGGWNRAQANANCLAGSGRRFCWRWHFTWSGAALFLKRRTTSCNWNVDPACLVFHLVGRIALFAHIQTRGLSVSHCCSTDALRRIASFTR